MNVINKKNATLFFLLLFLFPFQTKAVDYLNEAPASTANCGSATTTNATPDRLVILGTSIPTDYYIDTIVFQSANNVTNGFTVDINSTSSPVESTQAIKTNGSSQWVVSFDTTTHLTGTTTIYFTKNTAEANSMRSRTDGVDNGVYWYTNNGCNRTTAQATIVLRNVNGGSSGGGDFSLHPLVTNGTIENMNCVTSSTGTDCIAQYTNEVAITPLNILIFTILFAIAFSTAYWLVKRLT